LQDKTKETDLFMYCRQVRDFLTLAAPSWLPVTCFPLKKNWKWMREMVQRVTLVEAKAAMPIADIMA